MYRRRGRFGLLRDFPNLKHVSLEIATLLGGCDEDDLSQIPYLPKETLPCTLESLTLYGTEGCDVISELPAQLQELVSSDFLFLRSFVLEDLKSFYDDGHGELKVPYHDLEWKCKENGVEFRIENKDQLRQGRISRDCREKILHMREDGNERAEWYGVVPRKFQCLQELLLRPTATRATDEDDEEDLNSEDEYGPYGAKLGRPTRVKVHTVPFTDHSGKTAYMVVEIPLPPLFSFAIYFTNTDAAPEHVDMHGLYEQLTSGPDINIRIDIHFLPGAT